MATNILNLFDGDAFSIVNLTAAIQNVPYAPHLLGDMGLFNAEGSPTTDIAVEIENGTLTVIPTSPRGSAPAQVTGTRRKVRKVETAHIAKESVVYADQVQNVRAFGTTAPQNVEALVMARVNGPFGLRAQIELTHEYHRLGAIDGVVLDADGVTELHDWYSFFGETRPATVDVDFGALTADGSEFETECTGLVRTITKELGGLVLTNMQPVALCGDNFFDKVFGNKEVKAARKNRDTGKDGDVFGASKAFQRVTYGGISWANYRAAPMTARSPYRPMRPACSPLVCRACSRPTSPRPTSGRRWARRACRSTCCSAASVRPKAPASSRRRATRCTSASSPRPCGGCASSRNDGGASLPTDSPCALGGPVARREGASPTGGRGPWGWAGTEGSVTNRVSTPAKGSEKGFAPWSRESPSGSSLAVTVAVIRWFGAP